MIIGSDMVLYIKSLMNVADVFNIDTQQMRFCSLQSFLFLNYIPFRPYSKAAFIGTWSLEFITMANTAPSE